MVKKRAKKADPKETATEEPDATTEVKAAVYGDIAKTKSTKEMADEYLMDLLRAADKDPAVVSKAALAVRKRPDAIDRLGDLLRLHQRGIKPVGIDQVSDPLVQRQHQRRLRSLGLLLRVIAAVEADPALRGLAVSLRVWQALPSIASDYRRKPKGIVLHARDRSERKTIERFRQILLKWEPRIRDCKTKAETLSFIRNEWKDGRFPYTREELAEFFKKSLAPFHAGLEDIPPDPQPFYRAYLPQFAWALFQMRQSRDVAVTPGPWATARTATYAGGNIFPGLRIPNGSKHSLIRRCNAMSVGFCTIGM
jgi:hypothetical protein